MNHIVVFASGSGTNFQALIDAVESGKIDARIRGLIVNRDGIGSVERARNHRIEFRLLSPPEFNDYSDYERALLETLNDWDTDLIVLAGYLLKIPDRVIAAYRDRILNIHPSLLPQYGGKGFYGMNVHRAVIDNNDSESGCTVHIVTEEYDAGPVLAQTKVPVYDSDDPETLAARVLEQEHKLLPETVAHYLEQLNAKKN